ncbi:MAG TPA: zinc-binding dehydrogenase, partial [Gemmatimonadaceae bacterium]|nr:zinc-binding dehydrogenase [Gemmatimonadaceae bacterium]
FAALRERAREWSGGRGLDVVLDLVGGAYVAAGLGALATRGRLILVGTVAGTRAELDLRRILGRRLTIRGTVLRARPLEEKILATRAFEHEVAPLLARRLVRPVIDTTFPLSRLPDAHRRLASEGTFGKVVVEI